jgi:uncharacterized protein HemX
VESVANSPLLSKLLDLSIALFVLVLVAIGLGLAVWKLWQQSQAQDLAHAKELADLNAKRLTESENYAQNRRESSEQLRGIVEQINTVLRTVQNEKLLSPADRKVLFAIATKLGCTPAELQ